MGRQKGEVLPPGLGRLAVWPVLNNSFIQYSSWSYDSHRASLRNMFISVHKDNLAQHTSRQLKLSPEVCFFTEFTVATFQHWSCFGPVSPIGGSSLSTRVPNSPAGPRGRRWSPGSGSALCRLGRQQPEQRLQHGSPLGSPQEVGMASYFSAIPSALRGCCRREGTCPALV